MPPVRAQEVVRDESGGIAGGSASVAGAGRVAGARRRSRQRVRERLGGVAGLSEGGRSGVFRSPTRGLVRYDADPDGLGPPGRGDGAPTDESSGLPEPPAHVVAGDCPPPPPVPGRSGLPGVPGEAFPRDGGHGRPLAHPPRSPPRDGSRVPCDDLVARSAASRLLPDVSAPSPGDVSAHSHAMGSDAARVSLLRALASAARASDPSLGTCRHVGPAPLPGGLADSPPDALPSHGVGAAAPRSRLAPGPGDATGIPAWHGVTPGDAVGAGTLARVREGVEATLGAAVSSAVPGAGHAARGLVGGETRHLARMPARRGHPPEGTWHRARPRADRGKRLLAGGGHAHLGRHLARGVLGARTHPCARADRDRAPSRLRQARDGRPGEREAMPGRDKDWEGARGGFFVPMPDTGEMAPASALDAHLSRTGAGQVLETAMDHLRLPPAARRAETAMRGKVPRDVTRAVATLRVREAVADAGRCRPPTDPWGKSSSPVCLGNGPALVPGTPNRQCRQRFEGLGLEVPAKVDVASCRRDVLGLRS